MLLLALSVHSVFEGLAIGVSRTTDSTFRLIIAVLIHKIIAALVLGIRFRHANASQLHGALMILIFACATPLGTLIGMVISSNGDAGTDGICNALAIGTFLYIAASEIVVQEFSVSKHTVIKFIFFILGLCVIAAMMLFHEHEHHHH